MGKSIKSLFPKRNPGPRLPAVLVLLLLAAVLFPAADGGIKLEGEYLLYSDDHTYIFGSGNIRLSAGGTKITADVVYIDVKKLSGLLYGNVTVTESKKRKSAKDLEKGKSYDVLFFKGVPPQWLQVNYGETYHLSGYTALERDYTMFIRQTPEELKDSSLYFEFRECRILKNQKVKAKIVVPYMMGIPSMPLKKFTINRGRWAEKTLVAFKNVNYSGLEGLSTAFFLRLRENFIRGDSKFKLYERKFFGLEDPKRGVLFTGRFQGMFKKKPFLDSNLLLNSGDKSYSVRFNHHKDYKFFKYRFSQHFSGREKRPAFMEFTSEVTLKQLKIIVPSVSFKYDWKKSFSYRFSTPLKLWKKLNLNTSWQRRTIKGDYPSDNTDFTTSVGFNSSLFTMSSNYNYSRNLVESTIKKNFSVNVKLKPLRFLDDNITMTIASSYMFSSIPFGAQKENRDRNSTGINIGIHSTGIAMPLGLELVPSFALNHLWDDGAENFTDFNYGLVLRKRMGRFTAAAAYSLASRYRADNFWLEGNSTRNMNLFLEYNYKVHALKLRFYLDNDLKLENISLNGKIGLPFKFSISTFLLYYPEKDEFRTLDVFLEKVLKKKIRIQGGYSLNLKRFFVKMIWM